MTNVIVSESALRELLSEALDNSGAMGHDSDPPVVPNAVVDRTSIQLDADPVELRHLPKTKSELLIMVRNLLDGVDDDQSGELYKKIKDIVSDEEVGEKDFAMATRDRPPITPDINQAIELQRDPIKMENKKNISSVIKMIVESELDKKKSSKVDIKTKADLEDLEPLDWEDDSGALDDEDETDSDWDPESYMKAKEEEEEDDDDEDESPKKRKSRAGLEIGAYGVDGDTLEKIGSELGFTKEAAKKAVETAMERFKVLHLMEPEERDELVLTGVSDYVDLLTTSGELDAEEEQFMRANPKVVALSDTFRDFFSKYVKKAARNLRADHQDDED